MDGGRTNFIALHFIFKVPHPTEDICWTITRIYVALNTEEASKTE